ncbi:MAG: hypothetical protein ACTH9S_08900 [Lactococcus lactis]
MLISIHDHTLKRVGFLSNDDSETPDFKDDNFHRYLAQGTSTFDFTVNKIKNGVVQDYVQLLNERAYFSFQYEGEDFLFDSVIVEEDDDKITFNCLSLNLEMRNEEVKALKNTASHNIQWYFDQLGLINFAKISLGINQVKNDTRVINYDSEDTKLARLISVIQNFDAEFEFVTKLKRDGTLDNITLNIYKKNDGGDVQGVGQNRNDVLLSFGENVTGVNRKFEKSQIFNSLYVTGKDGLSWKNSAWSVTNSEGQEEFYKRAGESYAKAPLSAQMFPSQLQSSSGDIFTNKNESTEYATVNAMWGYALSQLKQYAYPLVTYEVTATSNLTVSSTGDGMPLHIGDTVRIQDKNFIDSDGNVGLFLSARVSELEISFTNPTSNKIMFSNYIKLKSEVSDDLTARMQEIINANTPYRSDITSTNGLQFKNGTGTTTLGAHIYFGSDDKETIVDSYEWSKDGTVVANVQEITVDASGVSEKAVYSFKATVAGKVVANQSVTITNVDDGVAGKDGVGLINTTLRYAKSKDGVNKPEGRIVASFTDKFIPARSIIDNLIMTGKQVHLEQGKTYILSAETNGVFTNVHNVEQSNNNATIWIVNPSFSTWDIISDTNTAIGTKYTHNRPTGDYEIRINSYVIDNSIWVKNIVFEDGTWTPDIPVANPGEYLWTRTTWFYSDGTNETGFSVSKMGDQGIPGPKGADGKTQYTHIAYANSADGTTNFSTSDSNRTYIGMYVDFNINDSTTPNDYSWTLVKGADGTQGTPGKPGTDGKTPYFHTAWSHSADGTDGFTTVYPNLNLLDGTKDIKPRGAGNGTANQNTGEIYFTQNKTVADLFKAGDYITISYDIEFLNTDLYTSSDSTIAQIQMYGGAFTWLSLVAAKNIDGKFYTKDTFKSSVYVENPTHKVTVSRTIQLTQDFITANATVNRVQYLYNFIPVGANTNLTNLKIEPAKDLNSIATPYMPSASEVTTADWPSYIGQYTDFTQADSTNPSDYTWSLIRGNDGERGPQGLKGDPGATGIPGQPGADGKTSYLHIAYATNSTGTAGFDVSNATGKTYIGQYTDFTSADSTDPSKYTWSLIKGEKGDKGDQGKIVSDTEPTTRFKGLTWKYSGPSDLTASDGTVIKPNTEYYYNGTHWMINFLSANNIDANSITAEKINGTDLEVKNGKFTDGVIETSWKNGTVAGSTNIEKDHLIITRTDSSVNTTNSIGLDSTQGLIMVYTENSTGRTISVGTNFQGMSLTDSTGISASISPAGVKLSSDVNWTQIGNIGGRRAEWKRENNRVTMNIHGGNGDGFPVITSGGTLLGILPTNARPPSDISMPATAQGAGATAQISINSTGEVRCYRWGRDSVYFGAYISYYVE